MVYRVFAEKKKELAQEAKALLFDCRAILGIAQLEDVRVLNRYDAENISTELFEYAKKTVFSEPQTDFIFAVAGEELGFLGSCAIIILIFLIVFELLRMAGKARDFSGRVICCGMAALIGFQSFLNIAVATGLIPNTGIPLPFVSYGLTSLVSLYAGIGIVLNVGLQTSYSNYRRD